MPDAKLPAGAPLFAGLDPEQLAALETLGEERRYVEGDTIFQEGKAGTHLYCVLDGRVEITLALDAAGEEAPVHTVLPGSIFGEFVLFTGAPRTATARAVRDTRILALPREGLGELFERDPRLGYLLMRNLCGILVGRINKTTKDLRASLTW
jgi:CRP-like cAMP-binding protein